MDSPTGTRLEILELLLRQELSSQSMAERLKVSPAAIRQHLSTLEALGLVERRKLITQPSRPTYLYRVSPQGMRVFPKRYDLLLTEMLEVLAERTGPDGTGALVEAAARRVADRAGGQLIRGSDAERWRRLLEWIEAEFSWQATVEEGPGEVRQITIHQCPFQDLSKTQPDVCGVFFGALIRQACPRATVEHAPAPAEPACCAFVVKPAKATA
jgi:DeoR family transcriptional regulator, suf operon transcriptional repressor